MDNGNVYFNLFQLTEYQEKYTKILYYRKVVLLISLYILIHPDIISSFCHGKSCMVESLTAETSLFPPHPQGQNQLLMTFH